jgi:acetyl-CoA synthetase
MSSASGTSLSPEARVQELVTLYGDPRASVARLLCDQHPGDAVAFTVVEQDLSATALTYGRLREDSERFAAALARLGAGPGDRIGTLMGKGAEYLTALMGIWRLGAVHVPLFTAFAPQAVATRLLGSNAKIVICDDSQRGKLEAAADRTADVPPWRVIVAGAAPAGLREGDLDFAGLLASQRPGFPAAALGGSAPVIQIYTSGTTGTPKGVVIPAVAIAGFRTYMEYALDVRADDVYWCAGDPGWAYGLYFGVIGAASLGVPGVMLRGGFSAAVTWAVLRDQRVTNFGAAPTVYRALRASGITPPEGLRLRRASSAGEPLTPEVNQWAVSALGVPVYDHYGQTETGMMINNHHHPALWRPLKSGSMGQPMPGWSVRVLHPDRDEPAPAGTLGRIAVDRLASPLAVFRGYAGQPPMPPDKFTADGRWYLTGDAGKVDDEGYFHFSSRDDDVILMAGYRIGPFEVESALATHPAVTECAAIAVPDEMRGEVLEAFVVLASGQSGSAELESDLQRHVKANYAAHAYPRTVHFVEQLPKTPSGKIQRFVLRQQRRAQLQDAEH